MEKNTQKTSIIEQHTTRPVDSFDKSEIFDRDIAQLVDQMVTACMARKIPVFVAAAVANDNEKTEYRYDGMSPESMNIELNDDFFSKMLLVIKGFDVVPKNSAQIETATFSSRLDALLNGEEEDE